MDKYDVNIDGVGSITEGKYRKITINGMGTIKEDIEAEIININGRGKTLGKVKCNNLEVNGSFNSYDDISIYEIGEVNGYYEVNGNIKGKNLEVSGKLKVEKEINFNKVQVSGEIIVCRDCQCGYFYLDGRANISGLLSADNIELNILKVNEINEIGGEKIVVKKSAYKLKSLFFIKARKAKLICNEIDGDEIYLEYTHCNIVRGKNIEIGDGCIIDKIEYTGTLKENGNSKINNKVFL